MSECLVSLSDGEKVVLKISEKELFQKYQMVMDF